MSGEIAFGGWLKQRRKEQGIGPDLLAEHIGCSGIALLKIEAGERRPSRQMALLLAEFLGVPDDEHEEFVTFARSGQAGTGSDEAVSESVPWRSAHRNRTNLPHLLTRLIGRDTEAEEVRGLLIQTRVRLLTLTGPPGIGKTRLAMQVALNLLENFDDGVFMVELASVDDPDLILSATARALDLKEASDKSIEETLFSYLKERRLLLVLDNFEHLLDAAPSLAKLMESSPWLKVIATSREALHLRGERRYPVPPLALPDISLPLTVETLAVQPSVALFVERAEEVDPDFEIGDDNIEDVVAVVNGLEGLPLAIELTAARVDQLSPRQMRDALDSRLELGKLGARDLPARQRTLRASIEWSYNLLNRVEQEVFRGLGVFVGGFTPSAVAALLQQDGDSQGEATDAGAVLFSLSGKNLVRLQVRGTKGDADKEDRFVMLEAIREFALQMLNASEDEKAVRLRHARYFLALAQEQHVNQSGPRQLPMLVRMDADYGNVLAGLSWLLSNGRNDPVAAELGVRLASFLYRYWDTRGYFTEGRAWLEQAIVLGERLLWHGIAPEGSAIKPDPDLLRAQTRIVNGAGLFAWNQGDHATARHYFELCLPILTELGNKQGISAVLNNIAILEAEQGRYEQAIEIYGRVVEVDKELGDTHYALTLNNMGVAYWDSGDVDKARSKYEESLSLYRQIEDPGNMVLALDNMGIVAEHDEDYEAARGYQEEALAICRAMGLNNSLAHVLANMGSRAVSEGDFAEAKGYYSEVLPLLLQQSYHQVIISCLEGIARLSSKQGKSMEAARLWGAAQIMRETGKHPVAATAIEKYEGSVALARGQIEGDAFQLAWDEGRDMSIQEGIAYALAQLA